ncbi:MAG: 16S rRNA (guanine(966)-N(2))-methyltransferase RsmD [Acidobacteria bacterium]|nr:16S rRNA (guanine(966)-N(2))-methyltransferase RsmD [Acidobacteriota bacterium]
MRIISGQFKGRRIRTVDGLSVRPTSDRLRETLFNILSTQVVEARFLDLCAGSGAVGIEACSRGASQVTFVENARHAVRMLIDNLTALGIEDGVELIQRDVLKALKQLMTEERAYDFIFFDPPYASPVYQPVLKQLGESKLLSPDGWLVVEHHAKQTLPETVGLLRRFREVRQGETSLSFYANV